MSPGDAVMQPPKNGDGASGARGLPCPMHGCKRVYPESGALESHVKDHQITAQSLPGKKLQCSSSGCGASFPSMQKLMEHARRHYKPNIYFQCESCRTKLRSYRGLLAHLHTCSKVPRAKPRPAEAMASTTPNAPPDLAPPQLESVSAPQQSPAQTAPASSAAPPPDSADPPALGPPMLTPQAPPPSQRAALKLSEAPPPPPPLGDEASKAASGFRPNAPKAAADPAGVQGPPLLPFRPAAPGPAAYTASAAVWRKNQATSGHRRVLWEHTRGRYTCVQCGHTLTNRKEMTQHINSQHHGAKPGDDAGGSGGSASKP